MSKSHGFIGAQVTQKFLAWFLLSCLWLGVATALAFSILAADGSGGDGIVADSSQTEVPGLLGPSIQLERVSYYAGDIITVRISGFKPAEPVDITIAPADDSSGVAPLVLHEGFADADGAYYTEFAADFSEYIGVELLIVARGAESQSATSASFMQSNAILNLAFTDALALCFGSSVDSFDVCARLSQRCNNGDFPLAGREVQFYINEGADSGSCGLKSKSSPDAVAVTDADGNACVRFHIPKTGNTRIRARFGGEKAPEDCSGGGNTACPEDPDGCLTLSTANDCVEIDLSADFDMDGISNAFDNCPCDFNPLQEDIDGDGLGDSCFLPAYLTPFSIVVFNWTDGQRADPPTDPLLNIRVTDPDGLQVGADSLDIMVNTFPPGEAEYHNINLEDSVHIYHPKTGLYIVEIIPEASALSQARTQATQYAAELRTDGTIEFVFGPQSSPTSGVIDTIGYVAVPFQFGNIDGDEIISISDVVFLIAALYGDETLPDPLSTSDVNCDHVVDVADVTYFIAYIFKGGPPLGCI